MFPRVHVSQRGRHARTGVHLVKNMFVFPDDGTGGLWNNECGCFNRGNPILESTPSQSLAKKLWKYFDRSFLWDSYKLSNLVTDLESSCGLRHFLLEMHIHRNDSVYRVSEHVAERIDGSLCVPFSWNRRSWVNIIVTVKNQGKWVTYLIHNMERILRDTKDRRIRLVIVDFESSDLDIEGALSRSSLSRENWLLITVSGQFVKAGGLQYGVDAIPSDDEIVFACDLHLDIPSHLIESIRKHSIRGRKAFAPLVIRLECGATPNDARGFWETSGYGLIGMYKSDWKAVGGMDVKRFQNKWGGEDWNMLDRTIAHGLQVVRLRIPRLYHYYHSHAGMWGDKCLFADDAKLLRMWSRDFSARIV